MADKDLFDDEDHMVRMTFGEHLEDLRRRLFLALLGFIPFVIIGLCIGRWLVHVMATPAKEALDAYYLKYYESRREEKLKKLEAAREKAKAKHEEPRVEQLRVRVSAKAWRDAFSQAFAGFQRLPEADPATAEADEDGDPPYVEMVLEVEHDELEVATSPIFTVGAGMTTLGPQEGFMAYMMVSIVAGLVMSSWWVIYQLWLFVAEGLYKTERKVVYQAMPLSVGLFLVGVVFCFFIVLPVVLTFFFGFNNWLGIEPNIRLSEWLSFATILPVIFGACFELPLVMLVLERVGIFRFEDYANRWRHAILIISIIAMVVTPTTDPGSMMLLMCPLTGLYFLGIGLVYLRLAKDGKVPPLAPQVKIRIVAWTAAGLYACVVGSLFLVPERWMPQDWFETIWKSATLPASFLVHVVREVEPTDIWWIWGISLGNAFLSGLVILRLGEMGLWLARRLKGK